MHHFGLDVGEVAFGYLAHRGAGGNALTDLLESGERIRDVAHRVIAWVEERHGEALAAGMSSEAEPMLAEAA